MYGVAMPRHMHVRGETIMKIWAFIRKHQKIIQDVVIEFHETRDASFEQWQTIIGELCQALQQSRPVILNKHIEQLTQFARTTFLPDDFLEDVAFDKFEVEIFPEEKTHDLQL